MLGRRPGDLSAIWERGQTRLLGGTSVDSADRRQLTATVEHRANSARVIGSQLADEQTGGEQDDGDPERGQAAFERRGEAGLG